MKRIITDKNSIAGLFSALISAIFAVCIAAVLLMGINVYKDISERDQAAYNQRTCAHYLTTKVRQSANPAAVEIAPFPEGDGLVFSEVIGDETYTTYIYCADGWLREYFTSEGFPEDPALGEKILPAESLNISYDGNLLSVAISGQPQLNLFIRKEAPDEK